MTIEYEIEPRHDDPENHQVVPVYYAYEILDREERELVAYHWHPAGISPVTDPHVHLSGRLAPLDLGPGDAPIAFGEMHLLTGLVTFADVVRLAIAEFAVQPRRSDWDTILRQHRDPFAPPE